MNPDMGWTNDLLWIDVPVGADGHEASIGDETWVAYVGWQADGHRVVPAAMVLRNPNGDPVTPKQWRLLKPAEIVSATRDLMEAGGLLLSLSKDAADRAGASYILNAISSPDHARSGYPKEHYAEVGRVYTQALSMADTQPVQAVLRHFRNAYPQLRESTVRGWVRTAKAKKYITETARPSRREYSKGI